MNFKKEYEKAFADISAGDDFKKQLEKELNNAASPRRRYTPYMGVLAAAALAIMVGAVHYTGVFRDGEEIHSAEESLVAKESSSAEGNKDIHIQPSLGAEGGNGDGQGLTFQPRASWCDGIESDAEKYDLFVALLDGEEVEAVYVSEEQGFAEDNALTDGELSELVDTLNGAVAIETATESAVKYYKVVLTEDRTIIFQIWNEEFVRIAGVETVYRLQK